MDEGGQVDPADLRVSHAEREHVLGLLQQATDRGMLDPIEFQERADKAMEAITRRDLNVLVMDISVRNEPADFTGSGDAVELRGWFSSVKRKGAWTVPRKIVLRPRMGSVELDFTEARIDFPVVEIQLDVAGGSVELRLPENASASTDRVSVTLGSVEDHRKDKTPAPEGRPHFELSGQVNWGSLELRGPRRRLFGR